MVRPKAQPAGTISPGPCVGSGVRLGTSRGAHSETACPQAAEASAGIPGCLDAWSAILAGELVGLHHPIQIDDVVERVERRPAFRSRQVGYPLSIRGLRRGAVENPFARPSFNSVVTKLSIEKLDRAPAVVIRVPAQAVV